MGLCSQTVVPRHWEYRMYCVIMMIVKVAARLMVSMGVRKSERNKLFLNRSLIRSALFSMLIFVERFFFIQKVETTMTVPDASEDLK
jgi:hypothetical protein